MKKRFLLLSIFAISLCFCAPVAQAQGGVKSGPDPATIRDPELEKDSLHNLEVARNYFNLKKAYVAALRRCEEVIAGNPNFAKFDEILYMAGESSRLLAENKGKQPSAQYVTFDGPDKRTLKPEEFREMARGYLIRLVNEHPQSRFRKQAEEDLRALGGPATKSAETLRP